MTRAAADPIYERLKRAILSGELPPDAPLRQDEIARLHGVSKIPVREALLRLEIDGYVLMRRNRGAKVRGLSPAEILNIMDIRVALESAALRMAVPRMAASDLIEARRLAEEHAAAEDLSLQSALNLRFHQNLYAPSDNPELLRMISGLHHRIGPYLQLEVTRASGNARPPNEHHAILAACEAQDAEQAVALLRRHIETTKRETGARLRRQPDGLALVQGEPA